MSSSACRWTRSWNKAKITRDQGPPMEGAISRVTGMASRTAQAGSGGVQAGEVVEASGRGRLIPAQPWQLLSATMAAGTWWCASTATSWFPSTRWGMSPSRAMTTPTS